MTIETFQHCVNPEENTQTKTLWLSKPLRASLHARYAEILQSLVQEWTFPRLSNLHHLLMAQLVLLLYVYHAHLHLSMRLCSSHLGTHTYGPEPLSVRSCNGTWYVNANRHQTEITLDAHLHCTLYIVHTSIFLELNVSNIIISIYWITSAHWLVVIWQ